MFCNNEFCGPCHVTDLGNLSKNISCYNQVISALKILYNVK